MTPLRIRNIALLVICLSLVATGLYWWQLANNGNQLRSETVAQAQLRAKQLNGAVAEQVTLLLRDVDFAAQELAGVYALGNKAAFSQQVQQIGQRFPAQSLIQIAVINTSGYLVYSNLGLTEQVYLGDRAHFKVHIGAEKPALYVSPPVLGRVSKQWSIQFSRPIEHNGRFAGVIVVSLSPDYLYKTLAALSLASDDSISIFRQSGEYLARNVDHASAMGKSVGPNRAFVGPEAAPTGSFKSVANFDKVVRLFHWQRLNNAPIVVVLGLSEATLLRPVEELLARNRWQALMATAVLWLFTLGAVGLLYRLAALQKLTMERSERLRSEDARLRAIYDVVPVGIALTNRDGHVIDCNPASEKLLGQSKAEQLAHDLGNTGLKAWRPDGSEMPAQEYASVRALKEGVAIRDVEMQVETPQGKVWLQVSAMPINADEFGVVVAYADITVRKRMEEQLRDSEASFRTLFEKNSSVMLLIDPESGDIVGANAAAATFYGYTVAQLECMQISDINTQPPERIAQERQRILHAQRDYFVFPHRLANGDVRTVEVHSTPIAVGKHTRLFSIIHDITQRVRDQQQLDSLMQEQKAILDSHILGIVKVRGRQFVWANEAFSAMLGYKAQELNGLPTRFIYASDHAYEAFGDASYPLIERGKIFRTEVQFQCKDQSLGWFEISGGLISADSDESIWSLVDITARKQSELQLRIAATVFESQEGMMVTDTANVILRVNRAFTEITGYTAQEAVGRKVDLLKSGRHDADFYAAIWACLRSSGTWQGEIWNRRKNGEVFPEWLTITAVKGTDAEITHYVATLTDITLRKAAEDEVKHLAFYDPLTRLPNRRLLMDRLQQALTAHARSKREGALLFIDLDNFKTLNDTLGHDTGDLLLQQVAQRLVSCVREGDTVARQGGDEFVVILEELSENSPDAAIQAKMVGEKILAALNQPYVLAGRTHHSTSSIGATLFNEKQNAVDDLMKRADLAMYQAKAAGRNTLRFFDPQMQADVAARATLESDLRDGLQKHEFLLHYQCQVDHLGSITGAEALVRWMHPQRGLLAPAQFIALAEETGQIMPLGHWVLEAACGQLVSWAAQPGMAHLTMAVNVSARQFRQPDFVDSVLLVLAQTGANAHRLKLELTESLLLDDVEVTITKMIALKAQGVSFALDDFGTGFSSLSYLKRLPLDQLKIDQSFVRDILTDLNDAAITRTIVALANSMGLAVIAEGVETQAQRDFLAQQGCHTYQGYLFSHPIAMDKFEALMKHRS